MSAFIEPGSVLGVLGGGQLGRMFAIAARRLGYRVHVLSPDSDAPTGQVADYEITASYDDEDAVSEFARGVKAVTFEFENVPANTVQIVERFAPVRPGADILHIAQNRLREKQFLQSIGVAVAPFVAVSDRASLDRGLSSVGVPAVLKTANAGYDGRGQAIVDSLPKADEVWPRFAGVESILEAKIDFASELSLIAARGADGEFAYYGPLLNSHRNHILDTSVMPYPFPPTVGREAIDIAATICGQLNLVGVICVEFFLDRNDKLLVNELAPRPHNSGHLTIDACDSCQFEQQVRALCGWPLGSTRQHTAAAMANLLGEIWSNGEPDWRRLDGAVKLHLYGKSRAQIGRKMGHLTALAPDWQLALQNVQVARSNLVSQRQPTAQV